MKQNFILAVCALFAAFNSVAANAQPLNGAMIGNTCAGCHGTSGAAVNSKIPPLAGANIAQFIETMRSYRDGSRRGTIMNRVAGAYSDDEIKAMAEYFASLPKAKDD